jgi:hypothetical protein
LGWRVWDAVTNLKTNSESVSAGFTQQQSTVTSDVIAAPSGAQTADLLVPNTTTASHASFNASIALSSSTLYTWSFFLKAGGYTTAQLSFTSGFGSLTAWANFILSGAGSVGFKGTSGTAGIQALPNGWYRCFLTATSGASATTGGPVLIALDSDRNARDPSFAGNGVDGVYAWGAQLNTGPLAPYVPTGALTASSTADVASITGAAFAGIWNQAAGTLYASVIMAQPTKSGNQFIIRASDNGYNNTVNLNVQSGFPSISTSAGGVFDGVATSAQSLTTAAANFAGAYAANDLALAHANATVTDSTATMPSNLTRIDFGADHNGLNRATGVYIRELAIFKSRRPNANLQSTIQ